MFRHLGNTWKRLFERRHSGCRFRPPSRIACPENDCWLKLAADVRVSADDGGVTLLDPSTGRIFVGNRVTALILLSASHGLTIERTAEEIAARFGIARNQAERDIRAFVQELQRNMLAVKGAEKT